MTADDDQWFIPRKDQSAILAALRKVPLLAEELAITETRQASVSKSGMGGGRHPKKLESRLPFHIGAFDATNALHAELGTWIRLACEQRGIEAPEAGDMISRARWLNRNILALAMTEGADEAPGAICNAVADCERVIDLPPDDEIIIDPQRLRAANGQVVTAYQVEKIAAKLGAVGKGLNRDRVRYLVRAKSLRSCATDGDTTFYRLGDVLQSHIRHAKHRIA